ncbi:response regulator transcription factor [Arthrobacter sp. Br18]|uniref:response regulator transcription factor n=1 Tax=Arthrobacter sp. Br18 TaxID=1312954 RepID=UPI00047CFF5E|nr:response regulator transcription factor [Arthrobacter sp. Br18]
MRVLVADDHPVVRSGLASLLQSIPGMTVVGQAGTGREAVREAALARPDVVVMDLRMPQLDGVQATREILRQHPAAAVLVLTMFDEDGLIAEALDAGARGYLLKGAEQEEIERAIRAVAAGEVILSAEIADKVLGSLSKSAPAQLLPTLTSREREVLHLMATGAGNSAIASQLSIAPKTVGNHISSVFAKIGVSTRSEAVVLARGVGLGPPPLPF